MQSWSNAFSAAAKGWGVGNKGSVSPPNAPAAPSEEIQGEEKKGREATHLQLDHLREEQLSTAFKQHWDTFRSTPSEREKNFALSKVLHSFCELLHAKTNPADVIASLVDVRPVQFVVARLFLEEVSKFKKGFSGASSTASSKRNAARATGGSSVGVGGGMSALSGNITGAKYIFEVEAVSNYLSGKTQEESAEVLFPGPLVLSALEYIASPPLDVLSLVEAGLLPCLVALFIQLYASSSLALSPDFSPSPSSAPGQLDSSAEDAAEKAHSKLIDRQKVLSRLELLLKLLAVHPSSALNLSLDDSLDRVFRGAAGLLLPTASASSAAALPPTSPTLSLASAQQQVNAHALSLSHAFKFQNALAEFLIQLLSSDNGSVANYVHSRSLLEILLKAIILFEMDSGDPHHALSVVSAIIECLKLPAKPEGRNVRLKDSFKSQRGYWWLGQLALKFTFAPDTPSVPQPVSTIFDEIAAAAAASSTTPRKLPPSLSFSSTTSSSSHPDGGAHEEADDHASTASTEPANPADVSPALVMLLDLLVQMAQSVPDPASLSSSSFHAHISSAASVSLASSLPLPSGLGKSLFKSTSIGGANQDPSAAGQGGPGPSGAGMGGSTGSSGHSSSLSSLDSLRLKDVDAVEVLVNIFVDSNQLPVQLLVLERIQNLYAFFPDNYQVVRDLNVFCVFLKSLSSYPRMLQEQLLKVLEYTVIVLNIVPEQELLTLCATLQKPFSTAVAHSSIVFFNKLLSFEQNFVNILREVGLAEILVEDLKLCTLPKDSSAALSSGAGATAEQSSAFFYVDSPGVTPSGHFDPSRAALPSPLDLPGAHPLPSPSPSSSSSSSFSSVPDAPSSSTSSSLSSVGQDGPGGRSGGRGVERARGRFRSSSRRFSGTHGGDVSQSFAAPKSSFFDSDACRPLAWDCMLALFSSSAANQRLLRQRKAVPVLLSLMADRKHRTPALRLLAALISEDTSQSYPDEASALLFAAKRGVVASSVTRKIWRLDICARTEVLWTLWRVLGSNPSVQETFLKVDGFSLTTAITTCLQLSADRHKDAHGLGMDSGPAPPEDLKGAKVESERQPQVPFSKVQAQKHLKQMDEPPLSLSSHSEESTHQPLTLVVAHPLTPSSLHPSSHESFDIPVRLKFELIEAFFCLLVRAVYGSPAGRHSLRKYFRSEELKQRLPAAGLLQFPFEEKVLGYLLDLATETQREPFHGGMGVSTVEGVVPAILTEDHAVGGGLPAGEPRKKGHRRVDRGCDWLLDEHTPAREGGHYLSPSVPPTPGNLADGYSGTPSAPSEGSEDESGLSLCICNAAVLQLLLEELDLLSPGVQIKFLKALVILAETSARNREALTSLGASELLIGIVINTLSQPSPSPSPIPSAFCLSSLPLILHLLQLLGSYRLYPQELRILASLMREPDTLSQPSNHAASPPEPGSQPSHSLLRSSIHFLSLLETMAAQGAESGSTSMSSFLDFNFSKQGFAGAQAVLGERPWPPSGGYTFACWLRFEGLKPKKPSASADLSSGDLLHASYAQKINNERHRLRLVAVSPAGSGDPSETFLEVSIDSLGVLSLSSTPPGNSIRFSDFTFEEGEWHFLALVLRPSGFLTASTASLYVNGRLKQSGKLGFSPNPSRLLQVRFGTPSEFAHVFPLSWQLGACVLFEESLPSAALFFLYVLGRNYKGVFQDTELAQFVPLQACNAHNLLSVEIIDREAAQSGGVVTGLWKRGPGLSPAGAISGSGEEGGLVMGISHSSLLGVVGAGGANAAVASAEGRDGRGSCPVFWSLDKNVPPPSMLALVAKKIIFKFDAATVELEENGEPCPPSLSRSMVNLVDLGHASSSPLGGPQMAGLFGDSQICCPCSISDGLRVIGGLSIVFAMLEMADSAAKVSLVLSLLRSALLNNPRNTQDMVRLRGYHLLAILLHQKMPMLGVHGLGILLSIACGSTRRETRSKLPPAAAATFLMPRSADASLPATLEGSASSTGLNFLGDFEGQYFVTSPELILGHAESLVLCDPGIVSDVFLDWTLWVKAPLPLQLHIFSFLIAAVELSLFQAHNIRFLRAIGLVERMLLILQRRDTEAVVAEKAIRVLRVLLKDSFLATEVNLVSDFVLLTFRPLAQKRNFAAEEFGETPSVDSDPSSSGSSSAVPSREPSGKHVHVRNLLLDLFGGVVLSLAPSAEKLEAFQLLVVSKLFSALLDESLHPSSMKRLLVLLDYSLSSPAFAARFRSNGGFFALQQVLQSYSDQPAIYYTLFAACYGHKHDCSQEEFRLLEFVSLLPLKASPGDSLEHLEFLDCTVAMLRAAFERNHGLALEFAKLDEGLNVSPVVSTFPSPRGGALPPPPPPAGPEAAMGAGKKGVDFTTRESMLLPLLPGSSNLPTLVLALLSFLLEGTQNSSALATACRRQEFLESFVRLYFSFVRCFGGMLKSKSGRLSFHAQPSPTSCMVGSERSSSNPNITTSATFAGRPSSKNRIASSSLSSVASESASTANTSSASRSAAQEPALTRRITVTATNMMAWLSNIGPYGIPEDSPDEGDEEADDAAFTPSPEVLLMLDTGLVSPALLGLCSRLMMDCLGEVLCRAVLEETRAPAVVEAVQDCVPADVLAQSASTFFGLCLLRLIRALEKRFLSSPEDKSLFSRYDKTKWCPNLEALAPLLVDRALLGAFCKPGSAKQIFLFFLQLLVIANMDGHVETAAAGGRGLLMRVRQSLEPYLLSILKSTNRLFMFAFYPTDMVRLYGSEEDYDDASASSFLLASVSDSADAPSLDVTLPVVYEHQGSRRDAVAVDPSLCYQDVLQLLLTHHKVILTHANVDPEFMACLCHNLTSMVVREYDFALATRVWRVLLQQRRKDLLDLLSYRTPRGETFNMLQIGFDAVLEKGDGQFAQWLERTRTAVLEILNHKVTPQWNDVLSASLRSSVARARALEMRRRKEDARQSKEALRAQVRFLEAKSLQASSAEKVRFMLAKQLLVQRQDKYGWILHAEQEWQGDLQQLVHERGIWPVWGGPADGPHQVSVQWKLSPTEGAFRKRIKLERGKVRVSLTEKTTPVILLDAEPLPWTEDAGLEGNAYSKDSAPVAENKSRAGQEGGFEPASPAEGGEQRADAKKGKGVRGEMEAGDTKVDEEGAELGRLLESSAIRTLASKSIKDSRIARYSSVAVDDDDFAAALEEELETKKQTAQVLEEIKEEDEEEEMGEEDKEPKKGESEVENRMEGDAFKSTSRGENSDSEGSKGESTNAGKQGDPNAGSDKDGRRPRGSAKAAFDFDLDMAGLFRVEDDGEYLIRPYLEPGDRIRHKFNCERVVGMDKCDGVFLIGEQCLYAIDNFFLDEDGRFDEKSHEEQVSVLDRALGVKPSARDQVPWATNGPPPQAVAVRPAGGWSSTVNAWKEGGAWGGDLCDREGDEAGESVTPRGASGRGAGDGEDVGEVVPHACVKWKLAEVHEVLKRRYQLRPVAIELFSLTGNNELLVFHISDRDECFKTLQAMGLPRSSMIETGISATASEASSAEPGRIFKLMARSLRDRWVNGEISNFHYLMHLNTLAGRGYNDLTQYPVFPWVVADYSSDALDLQNPKTFRDLSKPMGCLTNEREAEFRRRYDAWDDLEIPKFHYGSHYSSAGIILYYLLRLPPFSRENRKLQSGHFDHADRLFHSVADTWRGASTGNTADVKELTPEFYYLPTFLENRFNLDLGRKQSGEKVEDVILPPWAKGSAQEFVKKLREALESAYVSQNLHHWIDLIFGYKQRGKASVEAVNVFFYLTYEGSVDIDSIADPFAKSSILSQINNFGQTPRQLFTKPHPQRKVHQRPPAVNAMLYNDLLAVQEHRNVRTMVTQILMIKDKVGVLVGNSLIQGPSNDRRLLWGFPDGSLRIVSTEQDKLLATHEALHDNGPIQCAAVSRDGTFVATGGSDGVVAIWRSSNGTPTDMIGGAVSAVSSLSRLGQAASPYSLRLRCRLCAHSMAITSLAMSQPWSLVVTGSTDRTVILWDLNTLEFVRQLPEMPFPVSFVHVNDMTGDIVIAAGTLLSVWSLNGDCLAIANTSHSILEAITCVTTPALSDWLEVNWFITGHRNGSMKVWCLDRNLKGVHGTSPGGAATPELKPADWGAKRRASFGRNSPLAALGSPTVLVFQESPIEPEGSQGGGKGPSGEQQADLHEGGDPSAANGGSSSTSKGSPSPCYATELSAEATPTPGTFEPRLTPEYQLLFCKELTWHKEPVTALFITPDLRQVFSGDIVGHIACWEIPEDSVQNILLYDSQVLQCEGPCAKKFLLGERRFSCNACSRLTCGRCGTNKMAMERTGEYVVRWMCIDCQVRMDASAKQQHHHHHQSLQHGKSKGGAFTHATHKSVSWGEKSVAGAMKQEGAPSPNETSSVTTESLAAGGGIQKSTKCSAPHIDTPSSVTRGSVKTLSGMRGDSSELASGSSNAGSGIGSVGGSEEQMGVKVAAGSGKAPMTRISKAKNSKSPMLRPANQPM